MEIPLFAEKIIKRLTENGYEAYFVGGCVRDFVMGKTPHDYDIATSALPEEIKKCFDDYKTILTGEKHGTVTVVSNGENIEVTTYRIDGEYSDSRHPKAVSFTDRIEEDVARRDFTMNAIAYNGDFTDPFMGKKDIEDKIIRTVGNSDERFGEDALRIMRAVRFAATLGFDIEDETKKSIHKNAHLLKNISVERIYAEFTKLLMGQWAEGVLIEYSDVIAMFIPQIMPCIGFEQKSRYHVYDVYTHIVKAVVSSPYNLYVRLAAFFHDIGKPGCFTIDERGGHFYGHPKISAEIAYRVLTDLKVDNKTKQTVTNLVKEHQRECLPEKKYVKRFLAKYSYEFFDLLMELQKADTLAHSAVAMVNLEYIEKMKAIKEEIRKDDDCLTLKALAVNGRDLIEIGIKDGLEIGRILKALLESVVNDEAENKREVLLELACELTKKA